MNTETLKIYYSPDIAKLFQFKETANFYLPERSEVKPNVAAMYKVGQTIVTTSKMGLEVLKKLILNATLKPKEVLFIEIFDDHQRICTFGDDGTISNFFNFSRS